MEWTREKTLALINEYRKRRGLWDMTHDDYRKKDVKQNLLIEVSSCLGGNIPVGEIEKKFHTLRTQYHREINRMKRKEPYNSKWFGFKNLQFLSSPMARRLSRGRIKNEITEDGTVTSKYIVKDSTIHQHENSGSSANSSNINEEFLTIHQKPTITIETFPKKRRNSSRSRALEKLIEETTKDVEDIDDKTKMSISIGQQNYNSDLHSEEEIHHTRNNTESQPIVEVEHPMESIQLHGDEEDEIVYPQSSGGDGCESGSHNRTILHQGPIRTRIIKIHRSDNCNETEFYDDETEHKESKHIFYDTAGQQHTATIVSSNPSSVSHQANALTPTKQKLRQNKRLSQLHGRISDDSINAKAVPQVLHSSGAVRDEFTTYGEYVSNEMRNITNREVLLGLKHKINTALFEAQMAELQK
ncbi:uncharacterized protein [Eurosta solidaginis]|uniref:uncharacterized protein n=1 Tax=Eurosta solidaginis TaxID=178769 RepID=UPI0035312333